MDTLRLQVILDGIDKATAPLQGILKGTTSLGRAVKETRDRLRDLNTANKQLDSFRQTTTRVTETAQALAAARDRTRDLRDAIVASTNPAKQLTDSYRAATAEVRKLERAHTAATQAQATAQADMQRAGIPVTDLARRQRQLAADITAATAALDRQATQLNRVKTLQSSYRNAMSTRDRLAGAGIATGAVGATAGAGVLATLKAYADTEDASTRLAASMMQAGGKVPEQYKQINDLATRLGDKLPGTTADYQNMMQMLVRQGMSAKTILGGLGEATAYLAVQLDMPKVAAAEFAAKLQDATRTTEGDMLKLMDTIQRTYYLGVDSQNMLAGFAKLSPALSILRKEGLEAANALAPLLVMADQAGMSGETAGNAYRKIFQAGLDAKKMAKGNAELKGTGIELSFVDKKGNFAGMDNLFAQLEKLKAIQSDTKRTTVLKTIFGDDAETLQAVELLINKGKSGYEEVAAKMQAQANLQERVNKQLGTLKNLWDAATGTFTNMLAALGEAISPQVKALTEWIGNAAESVRKWAQENPRLAETLMQIAGFIALAAGGLGALLLGAAAILGPFALMRAAIMAIGLPGFITALTTIATSAIPAVVTVLKGLATLALGHPILALITALATAAGYIWANWDTIGPKFQAWWDKLKGLFTGGVQFVLDKINAIKQFLNVSVDYKQVAPPVAAPAPLRAAGGNTTVTNTNQVTVNAAPGQSPLDIGNAVNRALDERDRQRAAQRRSIFADTN